MRYKIASLLRGGRGAVGWVVGSSLRTPGLVVRFPVLERAKIVEKQAGLWLSRTRTAYPCPVEEVENVAWERDVLISLTRFLQPASGKESENAWMDVEIRLEHKARGSMFSEIQLVIHLVMLDYDIVDMMLFVYFSMLLLNKILFMFLVTGKL